MEQGEIILYQPDETTRLEVRMENETVWLNRQQLSELFGRDIKTIGKHINNALKEELKDMATVAKFATVQKEGDRCVTRQVEYYNLDLILSVGYRVKSYRGILFRRWANGVLKDYLLKGYSVNQRLNDMGKELTRIKETLSEHSRKIDFFVRTSLPPVEGIFFDGQIFDAYKFATDLIKSAKKSLLLIDNYVDESVLLMLSKRNPGVSATIYTQKITKQLQLDLDKHNDQYPPVNIRTYRNSHDRFLIIDDKEVYHIGASLKDLGKKMFAFSKLEIEPGVITEKL
ncbi:RhuM family protein [uncultured Bacteroides sp.]|uniref:virulence RhuM family protein n=1 Tax=uncultured Bacteroides sp. TaxID=162156 RepID=UPI0025D34401|nr:RhuM family protein [uncultured Bacteroides sp.]